MAFYDLPKQAREQLVSEITEAILNELKQDSHDKTLDYFSDDDTYIRKTAYIAIGRIYFANKGLQSKVMDLLDRLFIHAEYKVRQTVINAAGEIGKKDFDIVQKYLDEGLFDQHHAPRNAVIGSIKKMSEVNPVPTLAWARKYLNHCDKEIRREICHGIELRGRKYPQDILPLLKELQHDGTARVSNTLVHVLGQIAYKKGCLEIVMEDLKTWENKTLVSEAIKEIIDVHDRYRNFSYLTQEQGIMFIKNNYESLM